MDEQRLEHLIERYSRREMVGSAAAVGDVERYPGTIDLARMIDHTALKAEATPSDVRRLCEEAMEYSFAAACVNLSYVDLAARILEGSAVRTCTVIGFPLGATSTDAKACETELAARAGAEEVDMVLNVGMLKAAEIEYVEADVRAVVSVARDEDIVVKVILETALLTDEEKVIACILARNAGADFVKTSTGFSAGGATTADVALMRRVVGRTMGVKASGGIRSAEQARSMIAHGATRIGASASVDIVRGLRGVTEY